MFIMCSFGNLLGSAKVYHTSLTCFVVAPRGQCRSTKQKSKIVNLHGIRCGIDLFQLLSFVVDLWLSLRIMSIFHEGSLGSGVIEPGKLFGYGQPCVDVKMPFGSTKGYD